MLMTTTETTETRAELLARYDELQQQSKADAEARQQSAAQFRIDIAALEARIQRDQQELQIARAAIAKLGNTTLVRQQQADEAQQVRRQIIAAADPRIASLVAELQNELRYLNTDVRVHTETRRTGVRFDDGSYETERLSNAPGIARQRQLLQAALMELQALPMSPIDGKALEEKLAAIRASVPTFINQVRRVA